MKKLIAAVLAVLVLIGALGVFLYQQRVLVPPSEEPTTPPEKIPGHLRLPGPEPVTLDPHLLTDIGSHTYVSNLFSGLLAIDLIAIDQNRDGDFEDPGEIIGQYTLKDVQKILNENIPRGWAFFHQFTGRGQKGKALFSLVPDIAEEIPEPIYNSDGTVSYIFKIREDVYFKSGREVTAWDFGYSFDRAADPKTGSSTAEMYLAEILGVLEMLRGLEYEGRKIVNRVYRFGAGETYDLSKEFIDLPGVQVLDAKTLKITTKPVLPTIFYWHLTYPTAWVVNKIQVDTIPQAWTKNPDGTGPYWLEKWTAGQIVLRANPLYYGFKPKIEKVVYDIAGGSTLSAYENDELDVSGIGVADIQVAKDPKSVFAKEYFEAVEMSTSYIGLNVREPPFDDVKVRQAFAMAIDKAWLAHNVLLDLAMPAKGILPPGMPGYREDLKGLPFDPIKARELLAQSKYGGPEGLPRITMTIAGAGGVPSVVLQSIVQMWKDNLGVEVTIDTFDYVTFLDKVKKAQFQMFVLGWIADYPDPEDFIDLKFYSQRSRANNEVGYENLVVDQLIEAARAEKDPQKRLRLYQQAEDIIVEEEPWIPLFHSKDSVLVKPYLKNFLPTPMGISILKYLYFK